MTEIVSLNHLTRYLRRLVEGQLWLKVILAIALGFGLGMLLNEEAGLFSKESSEQLGNWLALPGKLFLKLVQMIMIPLIFTSIISGIMSNSDEQLMKLGPRLLLYFLATTLASISIGLGISWLMQPGKLMGAEQKPLGNSEPLAASSAPSLSIPDAISNLIPENPLASMVSGEMLSIVIFTVIVGVAITQLNNGLIRPIMRLLEAVQEICMTVVGWAMRMVPIAVFGLIAQLTSSIGIQGLQGIGYFVLTVMLGLLILFLLYMVLLATLGRSNPFFFLKQVREAQLLAFSTASSAAVMPLSMKIADEKLGVSSKVSDFVIPIGATINMDGTALFQCVSALFIAQLYGIEMGLMNLVLITVTLVAASIGTPAIPGGGVIVLASVLQGAGIPTEGLLLIVGIDRILGMFRTAVNVTGDLTACVLFNRWQEPHEKIRRMVS